MDAVLIILGILGVGAVIISVFVFTVAARNYVSEDDKKYRGIPGRSSPHHLVSRKPVDRRSGKPVTFPLTVNGIVVQQERRHRPERRKVA